MLQTRIGDDELNVRLGRDQVWFVSVYRPETRNQCSSNGHTIYIDNNTNICYLLLNNYIQTSDIINDVVS